MEKAALRAEMRSRGPVSAEQSAGVVEHLGAWMRSRLPGTVSAYLAMADEVDLAPLFRLLPGWRWVLPRVEGDGTLTFRDRDVAREVHRLGMSQPVDAGDAVPVHEIDLFLVPGIAFDGRGGRLGRGGGHYDRVLAERRSDSVAVGVTVDERLVEAVPAEDHDLDMDWVATESGVTECLPTR